MYARGLGVSADMNKSLCVIGCGDVFEAIKDDLVAYGLKQSLVRTLPLDDPSVIAQIADEVLSEINQQSELLFIAVDSNALNYARLELYGRARIRGIRFASLVHRTAVLSPSVKLVDNVYIGPMTLLSQNIKIGSNSLIGGGVRIDCNVIIGAHCSVGAGSAIGARAEIGAHSVLGTDVTLREGTKLGRNCIIDQPGLWQGEIASGTFAENIYKLPAQMIGAGYSHHKKTAS
jgi:carbonic anhydrase/acetyltransferase-like protein (isoleucine patch superfamily)